MSACNGSNSCVICQKTQVNAVPSFPSIKQQAVTPFPNAPLSCWVSNLNALLVPRSGTRLSQKIGCSRLIIYNEVIVFPSISTKLQYQVDSHTPMRKKNTLNNIMGNSFCGSCLQIHCCFHQVSFFMNPSSQNISLIVWLMNIPSESSHIMPTMLLLVVTTLSKTFPISSK